MMPTLVQVSSNVMVRNVGIVATKSEKPVGAESDGFKVNHEFAGVYAVGSGSGLWHRPLSSN